LNNESKPEVAIPETSCNNSGWKIKAKTPASSVDKNRVMMEGILRAINMPVTYMEAQVCTQTMPFWQI